MEILQLHYFFDSAKYESFAKTAEKYMVPTSSVSASVKRLEKEIGCELFDRFSNRIMLNNNGKKLQQTLSAVFSELNQTIESLSNTNNDTREINMLVRAMRSKITDYIIEYKTSHPHISFNTVFVFGETNFENYDIIIDDSPDMFSNYEYFELCSCHVRLKACSQNPLCDKKLSLKQLSNQPFLTMGEHSCTGRILMKACNRAGFNPKIVLQTNDVQCYRKCVESGIGIGVGRDLPDEYSSAKSKFLDVSDFNERQTVYAFYKKQDAYGNVQHFLNFLKNKTN